VITRIELRHFKCFELLKLPLADLTLLSGTNASGKSSVLQVLALLHQTMCEHEWSTRLMLNGSTLKLGTVLDVVDKIHGRHSFSFGLEAEGHTYSWEFFGERSEMSMTVKSMHIDGVSVEALCQLDHLFPSGCGKDAAFIADRFQRLTYITAERIGPREFYPLEDRQNATVVGPTGEHAVTVLHSGRDEQIRRELEIEGTPPTLLRQVEARMQVFFPGCGLVVEQVPRVNAVTLGLRTSVDSDFHRPVHVGFGLTQVLPIIVAALSARKNDILLIENPEVHLHPAAQALMGGFLAEVACSGVQVVIETHSDHVLNGIRRAVREKRIDPERVTMHFFSPRGEKQAQVVSPQLDRFGNVDRWPEGFFDQFDKDMSYFAGWGD